MERKNIRLPAAYYRGRRMYFLTLCFDQRRRYGANPRIASWLIAQLRKHASACEFFIHAYCIMPDHFHILAAAACEESNLVKFVEAFKQETAVAFARRTQRRLWQFKYYDRILRGSDSAEKVAWYIWMNPVRKGLCRTPKEYPFLGSFTEIGGGNAPGMRANGMDAAVERMKPEEGKDAALKAAGPHANPEEGKDAALKTAALH